MYLPPDYVIFVRQGMLTAQRLNLARGELVGDPVIIANPVAFNVGNLGGFSVSRDGRIAYRANDAGSAKQLIWSDHAGTTGVRPASQSRMPCFSGHCHPMNAASSSTKACKATWTYGCWILAGMAKPASHSIRR